MTKLCLNTESTELNVINIEYYESKLRMNICIYNLTLTNQNLKTIIQPMRNQKTNYIQPFTIYLHVYKIFAHFQDGVVERRTMLKFFKIFVKILQILIKEET